ncbi:MAG: peptide ABC transporter substrate-binding protein [Spirochaetae bacterium HGW-Spirochaetae-3]|nr:MAG: peptide ABC transporter substrate-binding protein [Spirochaetae bacterium HGW-Spirochaetae-3]
MKRALSGLLLIVLAATLVVSCGGPGAASKGVEFIMGNGAEPQTLDPSKIQGVPEHHIYMALFEGLVGYDPKTSLATPGLAESWTVNPAGDQITFKLRKTTWSDGTKITAQTVVDSWIRSLDPATASEYAYMTGMVVKGANDYNSGKAGKEAVQIRALDDYTFQCDLLGPMPYAVDMMAHYAFAVLPMHVINAKGDDWIKAENFVCNGPFKLLEWKPQESLVVVKNDKYWDAKAVKLSKVTFLPIDDNLTAYNKFKAGEMDWSYGIAIDLIDEIKLRPDYQVSPQVATYYYIFNMTRAPFTDVRVRKALTMALDKQELVDKVMKGGQLATTSMVPAMAGYTPATGPAFNVEEARKLLAEAGFPDGKGFPKTPIIYNTSSGHKKVAEWVQESWKKNLGIDVTLVNQEWTTFLDTRSNSHDFDIARAGWVGDYLDPNTFLDMFIIGSGNNDGLYANTEYDALIKKAATMAPGAERMATMQQAEALLITKDQAVIPFYHYVNQDMIDVTKWDGWYPNPLGAHEWKYISLKK